MFLLYEKKKNCTSFLFLRQSDPIILGSWHRSDPEAQLERPRFHKIKIVHRFFLFCVVFFFRLSGFGYVVKLSNFIVPFSPTNFLIFWFLCDFWLLSIFTFKLLGDRIDVFYLKVSIFVSDCQVSIEMSLRNFSSESWYRYTESLGPINDNCERRIWYLNKRLLNCLNLNFEGSFCFLCTPSC